MAHRRGRVRTQVNLHALVAALEGRRALVAAVEGKGPVLRLGASDAREGRDGLRARLGVSRARTTLDSSARGAGSSSAGRSAF